VSKSREQVSMEDEVKDTVAPTLNMRDNRGRQCGLKKKRQSLSIIRYADDRVRHEARIVNGARAPAARRRAANLSP